MPQDDDGDLTLRATFTDTSAGGSITVREVWVGMSPVLMIEPKADGENVVLNLTAVDIDPEETADILELIAENIRSNLDKVTDA